MKIDFTKALMTVEGTELKNKDTGELITLRQIAVNSALGDHPTDAALTGIEKYNRWELARRIQTQETLDMSSEEITKLKELIGKHYGPVILGPAYNILEGN